MVQVDTVENLLQPLQAKHVVQITCEDANGGIQSGLLESFPHLKFSFSEKGVVQVESDRPVQAGALVHFLEDRGVEVTEARKIRPSLEDIFVRITGIEAETMHREDAKGGGQ